MLSRRSALITDLRSSLVIILMKIKGVDNILNYVVTICISATSFDLFPLTTYSIPSEVVRASSKDWLTFRTMSHQTIVPATDSQQGSRPASVTGYWKSPSIHYLNLWLAAHTLLDSLSSLTCDRPVVCICLFLVLVLVLCLCIAYWMRLFGKSHTFHLVCFDVVSLLALQWNESGSIVWCRVMVFPICVLCLYLHRL